MPAKGTTPGPQQRNLPDHPDGFISKRQRSVQKDRVLLKQLEALVAAGKLDGELLMLFRFELTPDRAGNAALRTHFQQLTERFLVPLNRYFQTLVPPPTSGTSTPQRPTISRSQSFTSVPHPTSTTLPVPPPPRALSLNGLKPFSLPSFLEHLKKHGPNPLSFKSKGLNSKARVENDFYAGFCKGACFSGWLAARVESLGLAVAQGTLSIPCAWGSRRPSDSGSGMLSPSARTSTSAEYSAASAESASGASRASASERSSVDIDTPAAPTPKAKGGMLPLAADTEDERRLRRLEIGDA